MKITHFTLSCVLCILIKTSTLYAQISITTCSNNVVANITSATTATIVNNNGSAVLLLIEAKGGGGGGGKDGGNPNYAGGEGATVTGRFTLNSNSTLLIVSGGKGPDYNGAFTSTFAAFSGGGGGGSGAVNCGNPANCGSGTIWLVAAGGAGGGADNTAFGGSVTSMACGNGGNTIEGAAAGGGGCLSNGTSNSATNGGSVVLKTGLSTGGARGCYTCTPGASGMGGGGGGAGSYGGGGGGATGGAGDGGSAAISYNVGTNQVNMAGGNGATGTAGFVKVTCEGTTLLIELIGFSGKNTEGGNQLTWATATEKNVRDFEVQRSRDGYFFETIGLVKSKGSHSKYEFLDKTSESNSFYYQLKTNDLDASVSLSKVILLEKKGKSSVKIYPSVTNGFLTIENVKSFEIVNSVGQIVKSVKTFKTLEGFQTLPRLDVQTDISTLSVGIYCVKGIDIEGRAFIQKIIKQ